MMSQDPVTTLIEALTGGTVDVVDLTQPLSERTPVIRLPEGPAKKPPLGGGGGEPSATGAGPGGGFPPPFPVHYYLLGAGKYGVTQLANLTSLPPTGALLFVAPLKLAGGTGSPVRSLALVPRG